MISYKQRAKSQEPIAESQGQEPRARAREGWKNLLGRLADLPVVPARPKLTEAQIDRIAEAFAVHPVEVFHAAMARADWYGDDPDAQLAAALDLEVLRWSRSTAGMSRTRAWQVVTDLLSAGGTAR